MRLEGGTIQNEEEQRSLADDLRHRAVEELKRRKEEVQWFIEEDFDVYVMDMSKPQAWGGEPEILMLTHVLKRPIHVYMAEKQEWYVRIMEYGDDHREFCTLPIEVLFHGLGHYEFMERIGQETKSKL